MSRFPDADSELETPPVARGRAGPGKKSGGPWCSKDTKLSAILTAVIIGLAAFIALEIAVVAKSDDLDRTTQATVDMHNETTVLRQDVQGYLRSITEHFPQNQGSMSLEQIVDTVDKVHAMMLWVNDLKSGLPTETVQQLVKNANTLVGNVSAVVGTVGAMFDGMGSDNKARHLTMVNNAALFFAKGAELLGTVSPGEFHEAFASTNEAVQSMAKLSKNISQERLNRIVESASDILGAVESEHIISVIGNLVKGVNEVLHRFTQPGGLRLSLPVDQGVGGGGK